MAINNHQYREENSYDNLVEQYSEKIKTNLSIYISQILENNNPLNANIKYKNIDEILNNHIKNYHNIILSFLRDFSRLNIQ